MSRHTDPEWLEERYWEDGLTQEEIAERCSVSTRTIRRYMKQFDIETRDPEGENHPMYGKSRQEEVKSKIAASLEGREHDKETRQALAESHRGNSIPEAVRESISESLTGITRSRETREQMSASTAGQSNPNWKGGYSRRYGPGWATAREAVRERDSVCQCCGHDGTDRRLEVHHIVPVRQFRNDPEKELERAHDLDNLVLLCRRCHGKVEHGDVEAPAPSTDERS